MAMLFGWFLAIHILLLQRALFFPLLIQEPLVKIVIFSCRRFMPLVGACSLWAGACEVCFGSVNILNLSLMLILIMVVGSNSISPCLCLWACVVFSFCQ
jgi:hypothetical protein